MNEFLLWNLMISRSLLHWISTALMTLHCGYNIPALLKRLASRQKTCITVFLQVISVEQVSVMSGAQKFAGPDTIREKWAGQRCHDSSNASSARTERMDRVVGRRERSREKERIKYEEVFYIKHPCKCCNSWCKGLHPVTVHYYHMSILNKSISFQNK